MAQRVITQLVSDLSGEEIAEENGETIQFSYRGTGYAIDLTHEEAAAFDEAIRVYLDNAAKTGARAAGAGRKASASSGRDYDPKAVRQWARSNGLDVPERGRIPSELLEQYRAANWSSWAGSAGTALA